METKLLNISRLARTVVVATLLVGALGVSQQAAAASISTTKHNLGTTGTGTNKVTVGTDEICVFCHTPHAAASGSAPLWNKGAVSTSYTTYSTTTSSTLDGEVLAVGSISLACLSCHDGTQAMDNMVNAPGSGGYNAAGLSAGYTWTGANQTAGKITGVANLGSDLTNDHPIGIRYCGGGQVTGTPAGGCVDPDFVAPSNTPINGTTVWWVNNSAGASVNREKTDMILYNRTFASAPAGVGPSVECGSCHDPHSSNTTFLRIANTGSAVCLACHAK